MQAGKIKKKFSLYFFLMISFWPFIAYGKEELSRKSEGIARVASNLVGAEVQLHDIIKTIFIVAGIGLILSAVIKFRRYLKNPYEVTLGAVLTNLIIGLIVILLGFIPMS